MNIPNPMAFLALSMNEDSNGLTHIQANDGKNLKFIQYQHLFINGVSNSDRICAIGEDEAGRQWAIDLLNIKAKIYDGNIDSRK